MLRRSLDLDGEPGGGGAVGFYLQGYLVLDDDARIGTIEELDAPREKIFQAVRDQSPDVGVDIVFTRDKRWARMSVGKKDPVRG